MGCKPARAIHLAICLQWEALWNQETVWFLTIGTGPGTHTPIWTGLPRVATPF